jgi:hypothetical protein
MVSVIVKEKRELPDPNKESDVEILGFGRAKVIEDGLEKDSWVKVRYRLTGNGDVEDGGAVVEMESRGGRQHSDSQLAGKKSQWPQWMARSPRLATPGGEEGHSSASPVLQRPDASQQPEIASIVAQHHCHSQAHV